MKNTPYPTFNDLICCRPVFNSHEDFSVFEEIYAGFDHDFNLMIVCAHTDSDDPDYDCATYALIDKDEALRLAKRLSVTLRELPTEISRSMEEWEELRCPTPSDVRDCFKDITECLIEEGCQLRICRAPAKNGYTAC